MTPVTRLVFTGHEAEWSPDGGELFYRSLDGTRLIVVPIDTGPTFTPGTPELVFEGQYFSGAQRTYDIAPDGRFLMIKEGDAADSTAGESQSVLVENWFEELKARLPLP